MSPTARWLRPRIVALTLAALMAEADHIVAEGESVVLNAAVEHGGLQRQVLR